MLSESETKAVDLRLYWANICMTRLFKYADIIFKQQIHKLTQRNAPYFPDNPHAHGGFLFMGSTYIDYMWYEEDVKPSQKMLTHYPPLIDALAEEGWELDEQAVVIQRQKQTMHAWFNRLFTNCKDPIDIRNHLPDVLVRSFNDLNIERTKTLEELGLNTPDFEAKTKIIERLLVLKMMV